MNFYMNPAESNSDSVRLDSIKIRSARNSTRVRNDLFFSAQTRLDSSSRTTRFGSITRNKRTKTKKKKKIFLNENVCQKKAKHHNNRTMRLAENKFVLKTKYQAMH